VLFIVADDLNADINCYGQPIAVTPNIDRLATRGIRFDRAYAQYALCNPSRSSFLSGCLPDRTGVIEQDGRVREALPEAIFLPQLFRQAGYHTAARGKIHHGGLIDKPSWDEYDDAKGNDPQEVAEAKIRKGNDDRSPRWATLEGNGEKSADGTHTAEIARLLEEKSAGDAPFFLALGLHKPHVPWTAPRKHFDLYPPARMPLRELLVPQDAPQIALETEWPRGTRSNTPQEALAACLACVSFTDSNVGAVMSQLDRLKLWPTTVVVFMSDHGFHLGDHGLWSKKTLFEQSLHVPLIVVHPDGRNAGRTCRRTVELIDVYPTLAELCGLTAPSGLDGRSLRPLLDEPEAAWDHDARSVVMHSGTMGRSIRTERWRYTEWDEGRAGVELYDHDLDPLETHNLAGRSELSETVSRLSSALRSK
jgi:uncharacterized sulfatase